jgi:hypothetical protein
VRADDVGGALEAEWPQLALSDHDADSVSSGLQYVEMALVAHLLADGLRSGETERFPSLFAAVERCLIDGGEAGLGGAL